jgi:acylglycerol lipase
MNKKACRQSYNNVIMDVEINLTPTASLLEIERSGDISSEPGVRPRISARTWGTASECTAGALLVHGLGAHSGWFEAFGRRLKVNSIFVLAYDQLGFGKRGNEQFRSYEQWLDDLSTAYHYQKQLVGDKPIFIMANSMGAAVALKAVASKKVTPQGLAMFSPGIEGHPRTFDLLYRIKALLQAWTAPDSLIALPYTVALVTRQESVRRWLEKDPDMKLAVPARMLWELLKMTRNYTDQAAKVTCPVVMFEAGVDELVDRKVNQKLFDKIASKDKRDLEFEEAWHDLMFDPVIDEVVQEIVAWIKQASRGSSRSPVKPGDARGQTGS